MGWKHFQTVDKREPQVGSGLFGIRLLILHFKFKFTKSIKSSTFHISLNLTYPLRKNISFQKCPKITQKITQNRLTAVNVMSIEIQRCLKRDRDIGRKAVLSHVKTAFKCTVIFSGIPLTRLTSFAYWQTARNLRVSCLFQHSTRPAVYMVLDCYFTVLHEQL